MTRYFRVHFVETEENYRTVEADNAEDARKQIEARANHRFNYKIKVTGVTEEFGWQSEGDGIISRHG